MKTVWFMSFKNIEKHFLRKTKKKFYIMQSGQLLTLVLDISTVLIFTSMSNTLAKQ